MKAQHSKVTCERILYVPPLPAIMSAKSLGFIEHVIYMEERVSGFAKKWRGIKGAQKRGGGQKKGAGTAYVEEEK